MESKIKHGYFKKSVYRIMICSVFSTHLIGVLLMVSCNPKKTDIKEQLTDHKMITLTDATELTESGENPLVGNAEAIANGAKHYSAMCAVCHGSGAQGNTGPDLLDNAWLHGNDNFSSYDVIMNGIRLENMKMNPPRGKMPPYKNILGSHRILEVMAWLADQKSKLKEDPDN